MDQYNILLEILNQINFILPHYDTKPLNWLVLISQAAGFR